MFMVFEDRGSDSPFVERVWRCHSERAGTFVSVAASHLEMVVTRHSGRTFLTLRGPETRATPADCPAEGEWLALRFKLGTFFPMHPASAIIDRKDEALASASSRMFWLDGTRWEYPDFDNADTFVARLVRHGVIARDGSVEAALQGDHQALSRRSAQRHFLQATGMTHGTYRQIERARHATNLLRQGVSILDTVHEAGYFDQPHLTRSLKHLIGQTPARILCGDEQLSFLYKTDTGRFAYDRAWFPDDERISADHALHR
ncbi:MAG: helix-turn-helix domain-containing protein [Luteitalea sp.]|nr:helix-turn-helix domain-containing protein [Luteitalea sp.]